MQVANDVKMRIQNFSIISNVNNTNRTTNDELVINMNSMNEIHNVSSIYMVSNIMHMNTLKDKKIVVRNIIISIYDIESENIRSFCGIHTFRNVKLVLLLPLLCTVAVESVLPILLKVLILNSIGGKSAVLLAISWLISCN